MAIVYVVLLRTLLRELGAVIFTETGNCGRGKLVEYKVYRDNITDCGVGKLTLLKEKRFDFFFNGTLSQITYFVLAFNSLCWMTSVGDFCSNFIGCAGMFVRCEVTVALFARFLSA